MALFWEALSDKCLSAVHIYCTIYCSTYSMVGRSVVSAVDYTAHQHTRYTYIPEWLYLQICNMCLDHFQKYRLSSLSPVVPHDLLHFPLSKSL